VIRRLLAVAPAVVLVGCGPAAVQGAGHPEVTARSTPVATQVAAGPTATELAAPSVAPTGVRTVVAQRSAAPRGTVQPAPADGCNRNYTPCVPDDPVDVDCAGGSGNGPSYVTGPVRVIGDDVYGLDADGNGIGCEAGAAKSKATEPQAPLVEAPPTTRAVPATTSRPPKAPQIQTAQPLRPTQAAAGSASSGSSDPFRASP
jgi:hypothetical protein